MGKKVVAGCLLFLGLMMPLAVQAASFRKGITFELKGGFFKPDDYDTWNTAFGRGFSGFGGMKLGWEILPRIIPNLEMSLSADYMRAHEKEWPVYYVPLGLTLLQYSFRSHQEQFFVPFLGAGVDFVYGKTGTMDQGEARSTYLKEPAFHLIAGSRLLLDSCDFESAQDFDQRYGVNNSYLVFEARYLELFNNDYINEPFAGKGQGYLDPTGVFLSMGFLVEF